MGRQASPRRIAQRAADVKRALIYLRVSSAGQVRTDPEGLSIPAQRKGCHAKAAELGAVVIDEYVEPGRSATNVDQRPVFMEMMARIKNECDVDLIIVYARSRLHRGVNEYQSRASGADISYKMAQKVKNGGTVGRAKIGYLNLREPLEGGGTVATIITDPDRAPYIRMAFELYATGKHGFVTLHTALTDAGLRTRPTSKRASQPISIHKLGQILRDRYYLGLVTHNGQEYPGRHEPLISQDLFDRVQRVLDIERRGGKRERVHDHYLKSVVWCARRRRRLIIMTGKSHNGSLYFYWLCMARRERGACDLPYLHVDQEEDEVARHYATVRLPDDLQSTIQGACEAAVTDRHSTQTQVHRRLAKRLADLEQQEDAYLDLVGHPDWPQDKLSRKMRQITEEKTRLQQQLDTADVDLTTGQTIIQELCDLLADPRLSTSAPANGHAAPSTRPSSPGSTSTPTTAAGRWWPPTS